MQLVYLTLLVTLLTPTMGCAGTIDAFNCTDAPRTYTIRHPDMNDVEFVQLAVDMVEERVPEWTIKDVIIVINEENRTDGYGVTWQGDNRQLYIELRYHALHLATIEDLAHVLLHEGAHVRKWEEIKAMDLDPDMEEDDMPWCSLSHHELWANKVVIEHYLHLQYSPQLLRRALDLYTQHRNLAIAKDCPPATYEGLPLLPVPGRPQVSEQPSR